MEKHPNPDLAEIIRSPLGQQLLTLLQQQGSEVLNKAKEQAANGDYSGVQATLSALLSDPRTVNLISQMRGDSLE